MRTLHCSRPLYCKSDIYIRSTSLFRVDPSSPFLKRLNVGDGEETILQNNTPRVGKIPAILTEPVTNETFEMEKSTRSVVLSVSSPRSIGSHRDSVSITMLCLSLSLSLQGQVPPFPYRGRHQINQKHVRCRWRPRNRVTIDISFRSPALAGHPAP